MSGPTGVAAFSPPTLAAEALPIETLPAGAPLWRIHRVSLGPLFFGPGPSEKSTYRFDSATGAFGVLYAAQGFSGALVETLLRNPARKMVTFGEIESRAASAMRCRRPLHLVALHGAGLQRLGLDNAISTGPYPPCGAWADALFAHPERPDGLLFRSRHDPAELCAALFERPDMAFDVEGPTPLVSQLRAVGEALGRYGKSIAAA